MFTIAPLPVRCFFFLCTTALIAVPLGVLTGCDSNPMEDSGSPPSAQISVTPSGSITNGTQVTLDASNSSDPDGDNLTFNWSLQTPSGSNTSLSSSSGAQVTFTPDVAGDYAIGLTVSDGDNQDNASVTITSTSGNSPPVAEFSRTPSGDVETGTQVTLDASNSSDPDGDNLTFNWSLQTPSGSNAMLSSTSGVQVTFTPDVAGDYTPSLTVNDGDTDSETSTTVTATQPAVVEVTANIRSDQTWTTGTTYRVTGDISIENNALLTIQEGVRVEFGADASLVIDGNGSALSASGTSANPITMTGTQQQAGFWEGLIFFSSNVQNELNHVIIEYAGSEKNTFIGEAAAVAVSNGDRVALSNVTIRNSGEYGLRAEPRAQLPNFANNTFENNDTPLSIPTRLMGALDGASSYSGNTNDYVEVYAENVVEDMTVVALDVPYRLNGDPAITDDAFMQIEAGVTLQFTAGSSIIVNNLAALAAIGTSSNRITMTGTQNPDNGGFWEGLIFLTSDTRNELNNVDILYGGVEKNTFIGEAANVGVGRRSRLTIENCLLDFSGGYGGWANDGTNANVTFSNNTYGGSNDEGSNNWGE